MRKQLYLDLVERLKKEVYSISLDYNGKAVRIPKIKHFDLWNRQIEYLQKENPFKFPAIFIEFMPLQYKQLSQGVQESQATIRLHVVTEVKGSPADGKSKQASALSHLDLLDEIHYALIGWGTTYTGSFTRIGSTPNHDHAEIIEEIESYQVTVSDTSGVRRVVEAIMTPVMEFHLHKKT